QARHILSCATMPYQQLALDAVVETVQHSLLVIAQKGGRFKVASTRRLFLGGLFLGDAFFLRCCHGEYSGRSSSRAGRVSGGGSALKMRGSGTFFFVLVFLVAFFLVVFFFVVFFFVVFFFLAIVLTLVKKGGETNPPPKQR